MQTPDLIISGRTPCFVRFCAGSIYRTYQDSKTLMLRPRQVREDVTRYRYGDEQHLDEALDRVFRFNKARV